MDELDQSRFSDHKLCGFLYAVLSVSSRHRDICENVKFGTRCHFSEVGYDVRFNSENGVVVSPIDSPPKRFSSASDLANDSEQCEAPEDGAGFDSMETVGVTLRTRVSERESGGSSKKRLKMGLMHGSMSVLHQIHALVMHKVVKINAQVVRVEVDGVERQEL